MSAVNKTRERILDVSADLFRRQGMAGTGIKQILRGADAPFGSLYHHFPGGKDELAAETIKRAGAQYADLVAGKLLAGPDLPTNIREAFASAGQTLVDTDYADACPIDTSEQFSGLALRRSGVRSRPFDPRFWRDLFRRR